MIDRQAVIALAHELYNTREDGVRTICDAVCYTLEPQLARAENCTDPRVLILAASMLFERICARESGSSEGITLFKAGDVTVRSSAENAARFASAQAESARSAAAPLLKDSGFDFRQVDIG